METKEKMEIVDVAHLEEFRACQAIKKVPVLAEELMAEIFFIDASKKKMTLWDSDNDRIHYIVKGNGKLTVGSETRPVKEGMIILIHKSSSFYYSTDEDQLIVLSIKSIKRHSGDAKEDLR